MNSETTMQFTFGLCGIATYCEAHRSNGFSSKIVRYVCAASMLAAMSSQIFGLFGSLSEASSVQLFCFVGCLLGCVGAMRLLSVSAIGQTESKAASKDAVSESSPQLESGMPR